MDRTEDLQGETERLSATLGHVHTAPRRREEANTPFSTGSRYVTSELDELHKQVKFFIKDAQKRTLFEEHAGNLAAGSDAIKRNMDNLSKALQRLSGIVELNTSMQQKNHCRIVLDTLKKRFTNVGKTFQECLQDRTRDLSERGKKQNDIFGVSKVPFSKTPIAAAVQGIRRRGPAGNVPSSSPMSFNPAFVEQSPQISRQTQYDRSSFDQKRRAMEVQNIESVVSEVSQMFNKMAHMVNEQREVVDHIDGNMDESLVHVTAAQSELVKYYSNLTGERKLILKLLAVIIFVATFFIVMW